MRRSHCEPDCENAARIVVAGGFSAGASESCNSGGLKGAIFSGAFVGVLCSDALKPADVFRRVPQLLHASAACGFIVPQMGQRSSADGCNNAAQFLQNLLLGLFGVPHCGQ